MRGARCLSALLPAACRRVAARVVWVRAACELRFACTRHTWRLGEVLSVESVLIECTLHRANLTGRAGWYARRRRGGAPLSFQENAFDVVVDIVWSGEHERPLTLCERMCLRACARMSSIFWAYLLTVKRDTEKNCNQISWKLRSLSGES
jgi:hypothetical protein